jgi:hypothetical protein
MLDTTEDALSAFDALDIVRDALIGKRIKNAETKIEILEKLSMLMSEDIKKELDEIIEFLKK